MPADAILQKDGVTYFAVDVVPKDGSAPWRVMRRYNDFLKLAVFRRCGITKEANFPPKQLFPCKGRRLEMRRLALECWLRKQLQRWGRSTSQLDKFLRFGCFPLPMPEKERRRTGTGGGSFESEEDSPLDVFRVELPSGMGAEGRLTVVMPDGAWINIVVPWSIASEEPLELWFDACNGTLGLFGCSVQHQQPWQSMM